MRAFKWRYSCLSMIMEGWDMGKKTIKNRNLWHQLALTMSNLFVGHTPSSANFRPLTTNLRKVHTNLNLKYATPATAWMKHPFNIGKTWSWTRIPEVRSAACYHWPRLPGLNDKKRMNFGNFSSWRSTYEYGFGDKRITGQMAGLLGQTLSYLHCAT